ncbi:hypothetical protein [Novosphingobium sp. THN1]|uniref:hypothetical protein n=1 Tax=Novosphingobium sp. THN1 TaxID=1016987 RepID=UPI0013C3704A|nr:hypothetical protein [Novosphingobium sp. THN1]
MTENTPREDTLIDLGEASTTTKGQAIVELDVSGGNLRFLPASLPSDRLGRMSQFQGMRPSAQFPMTTPLPALSFCVIEDTALFLDLARDHYFRLPETANAAFLASLINGVAFAPALHSAGLDQFVSLAPLRAQGVESIQ